MPRPRHRISRSGGTVFRSGGIKLRSGGKSPRSDGRRAGLRLPRGRSPAPPVPVPSARPAAARPLCDLQTNAFNHPPCRSCNRRGLPHGRRALDGKTFPRPPERRGGVAGGIEIQLGEDVPPPHGVAVRRSRCSAAPASTASPAFCRPPPSSTHARPSGVARTRRYPSASARTAARPAARGGGKSRPRRARRPPAPRPSRAAFAAPRPNRGPPAPGDRPVPPSCRAPRAGAGRHEKGRGRKGRSSPRRAARRPPRALRRGSRPNRPGLLVHAGDAGAHRPPRPPAEGDHRAGEAHRILRRAHERALAVLDVEQDDVGKGSELLAHDGGRDEGDAVHGGGDVAHGVHPLVRGDDARRLPGDGAAHLFDLPRELLRREETRSRGSSPACPACRPYARARGRNTWRSARRRQRARGRG